MNRNCDIGMWRVISILSIAFFLSLWVAGGALAAQEAEVATGCAPSPVQDYGAEGFALGDFEVSGVETDDNNDFFLNTAAQQVNPNRIIIPMRQEVFATFISEGAGYESDFGYVMLKDVVEKDDDGNILYKKTSVSDNAIITGAGSDIWNNSDHFHFEYHEFTGNFDVSLRIHSIQNTDAWAKAGLMARESLDGGSKYAMALATPSNGYRMQYRNSADGASSSSGSGAPSYPDAWVRLKRQGDTFRAYRSDNGSNWTQINSHNFGSFNDTFYLGIAITSHNNNTLCAAEVSDYVIEGQTAPAFAGIDIGNASPAGSYGFSEGVTYEAYNPDEDELYVRDSYGMKIEKFVGWENVPNDKKHPIFVEINGGTVLDSSAHMPDASNRPNTESALGEWEDGTGLRFIPNGDGVINEKDMRKSLGIFEAGTELVFFLSANHHYNTADSGALLTYFTKKDWNPDTYGSTTPDDESQWCVTAVNGNCVKFNKRYQLGVAGGESWRVDAGWMTQTSINSLASNFGVALATDDEYTMTIEKNKKFEHVIVGAPADDPNQWILGFEDLKGGGDTDHNDVVFRIERKTGGSAALKPINAIPASPDETDETGHTVFYTGVTFETWDVMPCDGKTWIDYEVSIDGGDTWVAIPNDDWDIARCMTVNDDGTYTLGQSVDDWQPGNSNPVCVQDGASPSPATYRSKRIDFSALSLIGHALLWRSSFQSEDENCVPQILNVKLEGSVARHASFSRAAPGVQANMLYSGTYETPDPANADWIAEPTLRGHVIATALYHPATPETVAPTEVWDAGQQLADMDVDDRNILFPDVSETFVEEGGADGIALTQVSAKVFTGALANGGLSAGTLRLILDIDGQVEIFRDKFTTELAGDKKGIGAINRFTGEFKLRLSEAPAADAEIYASAGYVTLTHSGSATLRNLKTENAAITKDLLGLNHRYPDSMADFNDDGQIDDLDKNLLIQWTRGYKTDGVTEKAWPLGPVDHSSPALQVPPGMPDWYYGTAIPYAMKNSYLAFRGEKADDIDASQITLQKRRAVLYVGSRSGMLHAFDAGQFRWGDNPATGAINEKRGYFLMSAEGVPNYGSGNELWAFIPASLLSKLKNNLLKADDQAFVDASPTVADVYVNGQWRTLVMATLGNGGDAVFCLDVTAPDSPAFMWEYTHPDLFRSRSSPSVAAVGPVLDLNGNPRWAAFFVSGEVDSDTYPSIFMIDMATGAPLSLPTADGAVTRIPLNADESGLGGIASGQPTLVDSDRNGFIDRLYVGTDKGNLYKVILPDDPAAATPGAVANCVINGAYSYLLGDEEQVIAEENRGHPIYGSPAVVVDNTYNMDGSTNYNVRIFFGTGDSPYASEDINTGNTKYHFLAYADQGDKTTCGPANLDWFYELPAGQRVWASAFAAAGKVYFGATTAETEDPCEGFAPDAATGAVYSVDMTLAESDTPMPPSPQSIDVGGNVNVTPVIYDEHIFAKKPSGEVDVIGGGVMNNDVRKKGRGGSKRVLWREVGEY